jgi:hypothetical protein
MRKKCDYAVFAAVCLAGILLTGCEQAPPTAAPASTVVYTPAPSAAPAPAPSPTVVIDEDRRRRDEEAQRERDRERDHDHPLDPNHPR